MCLSLCVCVCVYMCVFFCLCMYVFMCEFFSLYVCLFVCVHMCVYVRAHECVREESPLVRIPSQQIESILPHSVLNYSRSSRRTITVSNLSLPHGEPHQAPPLLHCSAKELLFSTPFPSRLHPGSPSRVIQVLLEFLFPILQWWFVQTPLAAKGCSLVIVCILFGVFTVVMATG